MNVSFLMDHLTYITIFYGPEFIGIAYGISLTLSFYESLHPTVNRAANTIAHSNEVDFATRERGQPENVVLHVSMNLHYFSECDSLT